MTTRILVELVAGRHRTRLTEGLLRAQPVHGPPDRCRIGLLATTALLLGGDEVELDVEVGAGASLELFDVAATVAYDGRGESSAWRVRLRLAEGARLRWSGEPLVVSDGADVSRSLSVDLAPEAQLLLRETLALGRAGEVGGRLHSRTVVRRDGHDVVVESLSLDPAAHRGLPGMLGPHRILDTVLAFGLPGVAPVSGLTTFSCTEPGSTVTRYLGTDLASSPVHRAWASLGLRRTGEEAPPDQPAGVDAPDGASLGASPGA